MYCCLSDFVTCDRTGFAFAQAVRDLFYNLLLVPSSIIGFNVLCQTAMTLGMMPGIPLPFLSCGGFFTLTVAILIGLMLNSKFSDQDLKLKKV